jgi:hypothetical protein
MTDSFPSTTTLGTMKLTPLETLSGVPKLKELPTYSSTFSSKMKKFSLSHLIADLLCLTSTQFSLLSNAEASIVSPTSSTPSVSDSQPELMISQSESEIEIFPSRVSSCLLSSKERTMIFCLSSSRLTALFLAHPTSIHSLPKQFLRDGPKVSELSSSQMPLNSSSLPSHGKIKEPTLTISSDLFSQLTKLTLKTPTSVESLKKTLPEDPMLSI